MSRVPLLGSRQLDARADGLPPRLRVRGLLVWRSWDGTLLPCNEGISVDYRGRSTAATIHDSDGTSGSLVASLPAFTSVDGNGDGVREEDALLLSSEEALRFFDVNTNRLRFTTEAKTIRFNWFATELEEDQPLFSFTNDDGTGAYFGLFGNDAGDAEFRHYNGTELVTASRPFSAGDRIRGRALLYDTGAVQLGIVRNGNATESVSAKSAALEPADEWGNGGDTKFRVNEFGDADRGTLLLRDFGVYGGILSRKELREVL